MLNHKSKIFKYFLICFIVGVLIGSFFKINYFYIYLLILFSLTISILVWRNKIYRYLFMGGVLIALGIFRYQLSLPKTDENKIWFFNGQFREFRGMVVGEPDVRIDHVKLTVETVEGPSGRVLVSVGLYPEYKYGDLIFVSCKLKSPEPFEDFNYDRYLAKSDIYSQCSYPKVTLVGHGYGDWFLANIFEFKNKLKSIINSNLPEPQASLLSAIILGSRRGVPMELSDKFSITGTSHLIAISGLHITLIVAILMKLLLTLYIPRKKAF